MADPNESRQQSLSAHLLSLPETTELYPRATQSRFLELAGQGRLPLRYLSQWLSQDRLYAQAYTRFIGGLISLVELPHQSTQRLTDTLEWRILEMLKACLDNILRELTFFEDMAVKYGIDLACMGDDHSGHGGSEQARSFGPNQTTQGYIDLFDSFGGKATSFGGRNTDRNGKDKSEALLKGLVVLWSTEKVYLDAWLYAAGQSKSNLDEDEDGGALRESFIPNWTSPEFETFTQEICACLDKLAVKQQDNGSSGAVARAEEVFKRVLLLEREFWPVLF